MRIVFRDFPLDIHDKAQIAAEAAQCANEQGRFWDYHDMLFANQRQLDAESLKRYAGELKLNAEMFATCLDTNRFAADVRQDMAEGQQVGVTGTPAFLINGRFMAGAQPFETFQQIIDEELAR